MLCLVMPALASCPDQDDWTVVAMAPRQIGHGALGRQALAKAIGTDVGKSGVARIQDLQAAGSWPPLRRQERSRGNWPMPNGRPARTDLRGYAQDLPPCRRVLTSIRAG
jgi:hypothetical protein